MMHLASYGSWKSPITSNLIVAGTIALGQIVLEGNDVYWVEQRPTEGGRNVIVCYSSDGQVLDMNPSPFNARTRVHEYGGGAFTISEEMLYFSHFADQRLYRQVGTMTPQPLTPEAPLRYADAVVDRRCNLLICIREDHRSTDREAVNTVVSIDLTTG